MKKPNHPPTGGALRRTSRRMSLLLSLVALTSFPLAAQAGVIVSTAGVSGPGLGVVNIPVISTVDVNNDNQPGGPGGDNNVTVPVKRFDNVGYIDIEFNATSSGGVTEYVFTESVDNDTAIFWSSYTMQLGFGTGAAFQASPAGDGLDFDAPQYDTTPTSTVFASVATSEDMLVFSNGLHNLALQVYTFRIDVPDGINTFTLRQFPNPVPEPSTLALSATGLLGLTWLARRRRATTHGYTTHG